jgi:hypothetical protein
MPADEVSEFCKGGDPAAGGADETALIIKYLVS